MSPNQKSSPLTKISNFWKTLGPGLVTGASDDDPSGITTYSQAGSQFGLGLLWTALITFPLMATIQEMSGRIGLVTDKGIAEVIKENYPKYVIYLTALVSLPAIILNIGADLQGMGAVANMIFPSISVPVFTIIIAILIISSIIFFSYSKLAVIFKWTGLILLVYLVVPFLVKQDLGQIIKATIIPHFEFNKDFIGTLVAVLGTTISPYLFFWEAAMVKEDRDNKALKSITDVNIKAMRRDNNIGMFFSNLVMFFVILTTGTVLFNAGIHNINSVQDAAGALKPAAGDGAYILFAAGVIGIGFLAVPVLAGASSYLISETLGWQEGINKKFHEARGFYLVFALSVLLSLGLTFAGVDPIQALVLTAIIYGLTSPFLIALILLICNNKKIMGKYTNGKIANSLGILCLVAMSVAAVALLVTTFS